MPAKKGSTKTKTKTPSKLPTVFKDKDELKQFIIATLADCASIGALSENREKTQTLLDLALTRVEVAMTDYRAMVANGDMLPFDRDVDDEWRVKFRDLSLDFVKKVYEEIGDSDASSES